MSAKLRFQRYKRNDGSSPYVVDTRDADGKHIRRAFDRYDDACEFHEHIRRQRTRVKAGLERMIEPVAVRRFADSWLKNRLEGKVIVYSTYVNEEQRIRRYIKPRAGHMILHKIPTSSWERMLADICSEFKLSPGTHDRIRAILHKLYEDAIRLNHARENPITNIPTRADLKKVTWQVWRTEEECLRYLRAASEYQSRWFYPMVALAIQTGAREGELIPLRWDEDLDMTSGRIRIWQVYEKESKSIQARTKGKGERWQAMNPSTVAVLDRFRASLPAFRKRTGALVFGRDDGGAQNPRRIRKIHEVCCQRAGVPRIRFHDLRHQYASLFAKGGGNQKALQGLLGHSSATMTERYAHLDSDFLLSHSRVVEFEPIAVVYDVPRAPQKRSRLKVAGGENA